MISIISDTHIPTRADEIPEELIEKVRNSEITVHCGDFETEEVFEKLQDISNNFYGVKGNCDRFEIKNTSRFQSKGVEYGVYHGTGIHPRGHRPTLVDIARNKLEVDVLLTGHTHEQEVFMEDQVAVVNPGSATGVGGGSSRSGSPKMAVVEEEEFEIKTLELDNKKLKETEKFEIQP